MNSLPHFAYVMYWGALEPVGLATAVPTVLGLAEKARITLFSFEKNEDLEDRSLKEAVHRRLAGAGVHWVQLSYSPGYRRTPMDIRRGFQSILRRHREDPFQVIEGRTFVGGFVSALASQSLGIPFLYHTEGCWLEEQVDVGRLSPRSPIWRGLRWAEDWTLRRANGLVALTETGANRLKERCGAVGKEVPILVIPTTSTLVGQGPDVLRSRPIPPGDPIRAIYAGSVTGRYLFDELLTFFRELSDQRPGSTLEVLAHRDGDVAEGAIARQRLGDRVKLGAVSHSELPSRLEGKDLGFFFLQQGDSAACVSPTKIPEYLEYGIPVVCTRASGDGAWVIEQARAGVILDDPSDPEERTQAQQGLDALLVDPERSLRAQAMARQYYSLSEAVDRQLSVLLRLAKRGGA